MAAGKMRILITAGGTREYLDPVRYITNASSGKMGYALARAALRASHKVTLISAPTSFRPPAEAKIVNVQSSQEMFSAVKEHFNNCDCLIMAAAVTDYAPARVGKSKIKKTGRPITIKLKPTPDILKWAGKHKKGRFVVGFALEDTNLRKNAERKLAEKSLDMIIANRPAAIGKDKTSVQIKTPATKWVKLPSATKTTIAKSIISRIQTLRRNPR